MKKLLNTAIMLLLVMFVAGLPEVQAQRFDLAPNVGYGFRVFNQVGDPGTISVGAQAHIYLREGYKREQQGRSGKRVSLILNPAFDYFLFDINGMSGFQLDGNLLLSLGRRMSLITPYGGLGLGLSIVTGDEDPTQGRLCPSTLPAPCLISDVQSGTSVGLNLMGGLLFGSRSPRVMTQLRYTIGSSELHRDNDGSASSGLSFHGGIIFMINE